MIAIIFALISFFPFNKDISLLLEEKWFSSTSPPQEKAMVITYSTPPEDDHQAFWTKLLFQKMIQDEFSNSFYVTLDGPPTPFSLTLSCSRVNYERVREETMATLNRIKQVGFSEELLEKNLQEARAILTPFHRTDCEVLCHLSKEDFLPLISSLAIEESKDQGCLLAGLSFFTQDQSKNFLELPLNEEEKVLIQKIIITLASKNTFMLAFEKKSLERKGRRIHHVHPFRFLGHVFSDPTLKSAMHEIRKSHFKWNGFMEGYAKKMRNEAAQNNLMPYVRSFSAYLQADSQAVTSFIQKSDYEGLVRHLL